MRASLRCLLVALVLGVLAVQLLPALPAGNPPWLGWLLLVAAIVLLVHTRLGCAPLLLGCLAVALGLLAGLAHGVATATDALNRRVSQDEMARVFPLSGCVEGLTRTRQLRGELLSVLTLAVEHPRWRRLRVYWADAPPLAPGQCYRLLVKPSVLRGLSNPGGFDTAAWALAQRYDGSARVVGVLQSLGQRLAPVSGLRHQLRERLRAALQQADIVQALGLGDGSDLDDEFWSLLRRTGTIHLLVVSGLHIGLCALLVWFLGGQVLRLPGLRRLLLWRPRAYFLIVPVLVASSMYALLAGMGLPVQRGLCMLVLLLPGRLLPGRMQLWDRWLAALALILWLDPLAPLSAGFWLSFGALAVLLLAHRPLPPQRRWWHGARQLIWAQVAVSLGTAPLLAVQLGQVPLLSVLANLLAIPLVSVALAPLCLLSVLTAGIAPVALPWLDAPIAALRGLLHWWLVQADGVGQSLYFSPGWLVGGLLLAGLLLVIARLPAWLRLLGLALCLLLGWQQRPAPLPPGAYELVVFDVGQGLSVLVRTAEHALLYDAGPRYPDGPDMGARVVVPGIRSLGLSQLSRLLLSHGDIDHSGGASAVIEALRPADIIALTRQPPYASAAGCRADQRWRWDGVDFLVLWPRPGRAQEGNDNSCVLAIVSEGGRVLLPGDIGVATEFELLRRARRQLSADVLLAPHHGSRTSSGLTWLRVVNPDWIIVSAGWHHHFGHPHPEVWQRYLRIGATPLNTADVGAIRLLLRPGLPPQVTRWRQHQRRWWH